MERERQELQGPLKTFEFRDFWPTRLSNLKRWKADPFDETYNRWVFRHAELDEAIAERSFALEIYISSENPHARLYIIDSEGIEIASLDNLRRVAVGMEAVIFYGLRRSFFEIRDNGYYHGKGIEVIRSPLK